ncbi:MAG TPA: HD domain-containing phosphohydrolase [Terriglobales bacterium]|nr:HD domain-containing phosphohydrolase [Terriglobales bacterium]
MTGKILFVDDEPAILQGYQRLLRTDFPIDTAVGGKGALIVIETKGPYAVVVSDMRMPEMDGLELICKIKSIAPDTVRIVLTGQASMASAIGAINDGSIFRFLTKPCNKETMKNTLLAGLAQARLIAAEKEILGKTLTACIQVITEVLSLVNPAAFSRAMRIRRYVVRAAEVLRLSDPWRFEVAAMMSQLGCVSIAPEIIRAVHTCQLLSDEDQARYDHHPMIARRLLENIPRMKQISWMIAYQNQIAPLSMDFPDVEMAEMNMGAQILRIALQFDELVQKGESRGAAWTILNRRFKDLDTKILDALLQTERDPEKMLMHTCTIGELSPGMIVREDTYSAKGSLLVARGQEVTAAMILKLKNFRDSGGLTDSLRVSEPGSETKAVPLNNTLSLPSQGQFAGRM